MTWGEEQETVALSKVKENSAEFVPEHVKGEVCTCVFGNGMIGIGMEYNCR